MAQISRIDRTHQNTRQQTSRTQQIQRQPRVQSPLFSRVEQTQPEFLAQNQTSIGIQQQQAVPTTQTITKTINVRGRKVKIGRKQRMQYEQATVPDKIITRDAQGNIIKVVEYKQVTKNMSNGRFSVKTLPSKVINYQNNTSKTYTYKSTGVPISSRTRNLTTGKTISKDIRRTKTKQQIKQESFERQLAKARTPQQIQNTLNRFKVTQYVNLRNRKIGITQGYEPQVLRRERLLRQAIGNRLKTEYERKQRGKQIGFKTTNIPSFMFSTAPATSILEKAFNKKHGLTTAWVKQRDAEGDVITKGNNPLTLEVLYERATGTPEQIKARLEADNFGQVKVTYNDKTNKFHGSPAAIGSMKRNIAQRISDPLQNKIQTIIEAQKSLRKRAGTVGKVGTYALGGLGHIWNLGTDPTFYTIPGFPRTATVAGRGVTYPLDTTQTLLGAAGGRGALRALTRTGIRLTPKDPLDFHFKSTPLIKERREELIHAIKDDPSALGQFLPIAAHGYGAIKRKFGGETHYQLQPVTKSGRPVKIKKDFIDEFKDREKITRIATSIELPSHPFRFERVQGSNQKIGKSLTEFFKRESKRKDGMVGGSSVHETTGIDLARRPQDAEYYSMNTQGVIQRAEAFFPKRGHKLEIKEGNLYVDGVKIDLQPLRVGISNIESVTGKDGIIGTYQTPIKPGISPENIGITGAWENWVKTSPEGIRHIDPRVLARRAFVGAYEPGTGSGEAYARFTKDIPRLQALSEIALQSQLKSKQTRFYPIEQLKRLKAGYATEILRTYSLPKGTQRVSPTAFRERINIPSLEALKYLTPPKLPKLGKKGQIGFTPKKTTKSQKYPYKTEYTGRYAPYNRYRITTDGRYVPYNVYSPTEQYPYTKTYPYSPQYPYTPSYPYQYTPTQTYPYQAYYPYSSTPVQEEYYPPIIKGKNTTKTSRKQQQQPLGKKVRAWTPILTNTKGQELPTNQYYSTKQEAKNEGMITTDILPLNRFKIKKTSVEETDIRKGRTYKHKNRFRKQGNTYIEKRFHRFNTKTERQGNLNILKFISKKGGTANA